MSATEGPVRRRFRVEGRVQGVGFRWWTLRRGRAAGLRGWVRNLPDGAVEVEVEGSSATVADFRRDLERGPIAARVDVVHELEPGTDALPVDFDVSH